MTTSGPNPNAPIFIVGVHRSGTTLLRFMLSSSPRIYIPPESDFIPRFFLRNPEGPLSEKRIAAILEIIFTQYRFAKEWNGDPPEVDAFLGRMPDRTPAALLDTLFTTYARQYGAVRWGDKTPIYTSYIDLIHRIFPTAQFIHILRDGRDVALSTLDKWGEKEFHVDLYYAARTWVRRIRQARASAARLGPGLYYEMRYRDLVAAPERELRALCEFLGEPYRPSMVHPQALARDHIQPDGFHAPVRQPPNTSRLDRWRREMAPADQRLYQHVAGGLLDELGYQVVDLGGMSLRERGRLAGLATKYTILQAGRRVLQEVGLMPPI